MVTCGRGQRCEVQDMEEDQNDMETTSNTGLKYQSNEYFDPLWTDLLGQASPSPASPTHRCQTPSAAYGNGAAQPG